MMFRRALVAAAFIFAATTAVHAGGLGDDHGDGTDTIFFGVVQDARGVAIAGARVNLTYKKMSFVATSDAIGGYRIAIPADLEQSEITCRKDGYKQTGTNRRPASGTEKAPIEIDCTLQRLP
ncbi:MAG TPA: carboxypeptidase-like regulatory domain-containing protein [Pseudolabrys sp.]|jgi:hypothetical protein